MTSDRQGFTLTTVDQILPRPGTNTADGRQYTAQERENARLALHHMVTHTFPSDQQEQVLHEYIDMLGLRLNASDVEFGFDRRTPQRPNLTTQLPDGGGWYPSGTRKPAKKKR